MSGFSEDLAGRENHAFFLPSYNWHLSAEVRAAVQLGPQVGGASQATQQLVAMDNWPAALPNARVTISLLLLFSPKRSLSGLWVSRHVCDSVASRLHCPA